MDIVTHTMMGAIAAAPLVGSHPMVACGILLGSVLPDVDILAGTFGTRAMMRAHQTVTHSFAGVVFAAIACALCIRALDVPDAMRADLDLAPVGLAIGMTVHILTDWTNTYGVKLLSPLRGERMCREWIFFIDAFVVATNTCTLALMAWAWTSHPEVLAPLCAAHFIVLALYWAWRGWWRERAGRQAPEGTTSLIPSALWPHRFHGYRLLEGGHVAELFEWDAYADTRRGPVRRVAVLDDLWSERLAGVPEFDLMRHLSPGFHVVDERDGKLFCQDLRTRNFGTNFGDLELVIGSDGALTVERWHV